MKPQRYSELSREQRRQLRNEYIRYQKHICLYCKGDLTRPPDDDIQKIPIDWGLFPPNFLKYPVHLQHNHDTDMTEGAVHAYCNAVLWQYEGR